MPKRYLHTHDMVQKKRHLIEYTYHAMVTPLQSLELLGVVLAEQCHVYIDCHGEIPQRVGR